MQRILSWTESIRNKIAYGVLTFVVILLLAVSAIASVTMGRIEMMITDMGLGLVSIMLNLMAILFTIQSIQQEKEGRTLYVLLTRLSGRWQYIAGKFVGLAVILALQAALMLGLLALLISVFGEIFWISYLQAALALVLEAWVVSAIAILFSQASSLFLAILLTLAVDIAGRFVSVINHLAIQLDGNAAAYFVKAVALTLPDLESINLNSDAGYIGYYAWGHVAQVGGYALIECIVLLTLSCIIFQRRNLS